MKFVDFPSDINKNLAKSLEILELQVLQISEKTSSPLLRTTLNSALDWVRPHSRFLGLRTSVLTNEKIEMVLPHSLEEASQMFLATQCFRSLWNRHAPRAQYQIQIKELQWKSLVACTGEIRARWHLGGLERESVFAQIAKGTVASTAAQVLLYNSQEQWIGEVDIKATIESIGPLRINS